MAKYLRPRRGKYEYASSQNIALKRGEMFICLSNNDDVGKGPGALYIGDGASSFTQFSHNGSTVANTAQPALIHPMIYKPIFANSSPSTASWSVNSATSEINGIGDGAASVALPTIVGNIKGALCKHEDSITAINNQLPTDFVGATTAAAGTHGLVPAPGTSDTEKFLKADGSWQTVSTSDTKVTQTESTTDAEYEVLLSNNSSTATETDGVKKSSGMKYNPSTGNATVFGKLTVGTAPTNNMDVTTKKYVDDAIDALPEPMVYKGTIGTGGTITDLPNASTANEGFTYKVITAGTYASQSANVGDVFTSNATSWVLFPAGDPDTDTWRNIKVNGTEKLGSGISSGALDFINGNNTTVTFDNTNKTLQIDTVSTDISVTQTESSTNADYEVLLSNNASTATETDGVKKSSGMKYNPSTGNMTIAGILTDKNGPQTIKRISEAEYQALSTAEKNNGTIYHRYDKTASASLDTKVTQTESDADVEYEILLSNNASTAEETDSVKKSAGFKYNPSKKAFSFGTRKNGSTVGISSVAEGSYTTASGIASHSEGSNTVASGPASHAEGVFTTASGNDSHAEGRSTVANHASQHVFGEYNIPDASTATAIDRGTYVEIVGNGDWNTASNARTLDWDGNEVLAGKLTVGTAPTNNMDVATKKYVDDAIDAAVTQALAASY